VAGGAPARRGPAAGPTTRVNGRHADARIPTPTEVAPVAPRRHRVTVVRRLLWRGVTPTTLVALLPDWEPLIRSVAAEVGARTAGDHLNRRDR
jgi:hypothetical protein